MHRALDARLSCLDFASATDLGLFLQIHHNGFSRIATGEHTVSDAIRADLLARLAQGLGAMGWSPQQQDPRRFFCGIAVDYVTLGSRLGARVLAKRFAREAPPRLADAGAYFAAAPSADLWKDFCRTVARLPATGAKADRAVDDARRIFAGFAVAAQDCNAERAGTGDGQRMLV